MSTPSVSPKTNRTPWLLAGTLGCLALCLVTAIVSGGAYFLFGASQQNPVSQNLGSITPLPLPTNNPLATAAPVSTAAPAPTRSASQNNAALYLKPFCNCKETVAIGQPVTLRYAWLAASAQYVADYVQASTRTVFIDGKRYDNLERYWQPTAYSAANQGYQADWIFSLPPLSPGMHTIETFVDLKRQITDGFDSNKDNAPDVYGPWDSVSGHVDVLVGSSAAAAGQCANGGVAGTFRYTMILPAGNPSETWFDGERKILKPGENIFYLSANQAHQQSTVGGHTITLQEPECVTRTWWSEWPSTTISFDHEMPVAVPTAAIRPTNTPADSGTSATLIDSFKRSDKFYLTERNSNECQMAYEANGGFTIKVKKQFYACWQTYAQRYTNFKMDVDVIMSSGEGWGGGGANLLFGFQDSRNLFESTVTRLKGYSQVDKMLDGKWLKLMDWEKGARTSNPDPSNATRAHIILQVQNQTAKVWIGDVLAETVKLPGYQRGNVGIGASAFGHDAMVTFKSLRVDPLP